MGYYKFNPKNHICSLVWTGIVLVSQLESGSNLMENIFTTSLMGLPTVFIGINIRERSEKAKRNKIVKYIDKNKEVTVSQIANWLSLSGQEAREILNSLVREERIDMTNRSNDMAVVYFLAN